MNNADRQVVVTDIQMPFRSMVIFMFKWGLAAIPVALVLLVLGMVMASVTAGLLTGAGHAATATPATAISAEPTLPDDPHFKPRLPSSPFNKP